MALLVLACAAGCEVTAVHVDHSLRPGSEAEADLVESAAGRFGARFERRTAEVGPGPNLEARARAARKAVLPPGTATGHTMDDQAETVLIRLLRGTGPDGLAAMRRGNDHPILGLRRSETVALNEAYGIEYFEDPSNRDLSIVRNRVRHEVLPLCSDIARRDVAPLLARLAELAADDADYLASQAGALDASDAKALGDAPGVVARRAVREWLRADGPYPPDHAAIDRVMAVARGEIPGTHIAPSVSVRRTAGRLRVEPVDAGRAAAADGGAC